MNEPRELALLSSASRALCEARTVDEVKDIRDKAEAVKAYARKAKLGQSILIEASTIKVSAERKLGSILSETDRATASPGNQFTGTQQPKPEAPPTLESLGITKSDSSRLQAIARLPEELFEDYLLESTEAKREPTTAGLLRLAKQQASSKKATQSDSSVSGAASESLPEEVISDLDELIKNGGRFSTILADPLPSQASPANDESRRPTLSLDELCALPIEALTNDDAHLHLWTNPEHLLDALDVIESWGFEYQHCLVTVGSASVQGEYWHGAHRMLLLGSRGKLSFLDKSKRSWIQPGRSRKDDQDVVVRRLIESVSPTPHLLLFANGPVRGWTSHVVATN